MHVVSGVRTVQRWVKTVSSYLTISARFVLKKYQKHMGHVDRVDENVALAAIRLHRCKLRYHHQLFFWLLSAVAFNNVFVLFMFIFAAAVEFQTRNENNDFGWKHWFQLELSLTLMKRGRHMCDVQHRNKAVRVLISFVRSVSWEKMEGLPCQSLQLSSAAALARRLRPSVCTIGTVLVYQYCKQTGVINLKLVLD